MWKGRLFQSLGPATEKARSAQQPRPSPSLYRHLLYLAFTGHYCLYTQYQENDKPALHHIRCCWEHLALSGSFPMTVEVRTVVQPEWQVYVWMYRSAR